MDVNDICLYSQQLAWFSLNIWGLPPSQDGSSRDHDSPLSHQNYSKERCIPGIPSWRSDSIFLQQLCYSWLSGSQVTKVDFKLQLTDVEKMTFFFQNSILQPQWNYRFRKRSQTDKSMTEVLRGVRVTTPEYMVLLVSSITTCWTNTCYEPPRVKQYDVPSTICVAFPTPPKSWIWIYLSF